MTIHSTEYGRHQGWIVGQPQTRIHLAEHRIVDRADRVIVCSDFMRGHLADVFSLDERRIDVIANGVDPADLGEAKRAEEDLGEANPADRGEAKSERRLEVEVSPPAVLESLRPGFAAADRPLVLMVGRLVYEKGFQVGLAALDRLTRRMPGLRFVIAGTGIYEGELRAQASALGLDRYGSFVGWVGDERLGSLYRVADVCVVPSIYEPAGLVALEAMACGCPCVVADTGGLREAVGHGRTGLRFAARDAGSLASMVELLLRERELRDEIVRAGREHVAGVDWASAAAATAAVYSGLADTSPAVSRGRRQSPGRS
jgi:glycogen(starch) synthase